MDEYNFGGGVEGVEAIGDGVLSFGEWKAKGFDSGSVVRSLPTTSELVDAAAALVEL